jgi:hypothetical protein
MRKKNHSVPREVLNLSLEKQHLIEKEGQMGDPLPPFPDKHSKPPWSRSLDSVTTFWFDFLYSSESDIWWCLQDGGRLPVPKPTFSKEELLPRSLSSSSSNTEYQRKEA